MKDSDFDLYVHKPDDNDKDDTLAVSKAKPENVHEGHRKRMRARFYENGFSGFSDHEVLEFLLYHSIKIQDTNEIAHKMINRFGSLYNLFEADTKEIMKICKCKEATALLISMVPHLARRYEKCRWEPRELIDSSTKAASFAKHLFIGETVECFYMICLDNQSRLIGTELLGKGTTTEAHFYKKDIITSALKRQAVSVIITHNHPSGYLNPSAEDEISTREIISALRTIDVTVVDHIICAGDKYLSFTEKRIFGFGRN